jgi:alanyl aminopeptidase
MNRMFRTAAAWWVLCLVLLPSRGLATTKGRLDTPARPTFESVELDLDATRTDYSGNVSIAVTVTGPTDRIEFHAEEMSIERAELRSDDGVSMPLECEAEDGGFVVATTPATIDPGEYTLVVEFEKEYNTKAVGLYRVVEEGTGYLFTQFEAVDARKAFPCWDEPSYKIPWQITVRIPEGQEVITNSPVDKETASDGYRTVVFEKTPPMPSYLVAIAAGPFEHFDITGMSVPGRVYCTRGQRHLAALAAEVAPPTLAALEKWFERPYPYKKLDLIAVPEYWPGAMENPGAVTYRDNILLLDADNASVSQKRTLARVTAHEFSHMWFGDLVTMSWWDDLWLNESFADWLGDKISNGLFPEYEIEITELQASQNIMSSDARPSSTAIRQPVDSPDDIEEDFMLAYQKGKTMLRMVEMWIGESAFHRGVLDYIGAHEWGNTVAQDLFDSLSNASDTDIQPVLSSFLDQPGFPLVTADVTDDGVVTLKQRRFLNHGVDGEAQVWVLPVRLKYSDGGSIQSRTVLLEDEQARVELGTKVEWLHANAGSYGYYRWRVPADMMYTMAENPALLDARERATFLSNANALLDAGAFAGDEYLAVLSAFAQSPEPEAVSAVMSSLGGVEGAFVTEELEEPFAVYVRESLRPALERIGLEPTRGEDDVLTMLRPRLWAWLGTRGHDEEVQAHCAELASKFVDDPSSVDAQVAGVALRVAAHDGDQELFDACRAGAEAAEEPTIRGVFLSALGNFSEPSLQEAAMEYAVGGEVRLNEMFQIIGPIMQTPEGQDRVYNWFTTNYDRVTSRMPPMFRSFAPFIASGCSAQRLEAAREFFSLPEHSSPGIEKSLAKVTDQVMDCVSLRDREGAAVAGYLERFVAAH